MSKKKIMALMMAGVMMFSVTACGGTDAPSDVPDKEPAVEEPAEPAEPAASAGEKNCLGAAENYLSTMSFSKKGLKEQLKFEDYSDSEINYAVNHVDVNWKEQAVGAAKNYLDSMSFSRNSLIEQLEFDGFTSEQAQYGVDQAYK